jgi:hypothetical protein
LATSLRVITPASTLAASRPHRSSRWPTAGNALAATTDPAEIKDINAKLDAFEHARLRALQHRGDAAGQRKARWKLGGALAAVERIHGARPKLSSPRENFARFLKTIGLDKTLGMKAQRIGAMPDDELAKACEVARAEGSLLRYANLIVPAGPGQRTDLTSRPENARFGGLSRPLVSTRRPASRGRLAGVVRE